MANFDTSALALAAVCPSNKMILDDKGMPGFYVQVGAQNLSDLLADGDDTVHPAFRVSGVEKPYIYIGKYQGVEDNGRIYSLPGVDPKVSITLDQYEARCRVKGVGHHCITAAEWAFLALWCRKTGTMPKGNNDYGKDISEASYQAIPIGDRDSSGRIQRVASGTGPLSWRHNGQVDGVCDLNGNIWEWVSGLRMVNGELQVIPYNNAADPDVDTGADSAQWKAIKANATSWENLFITPNGQGTTTGSVKLDYVSEHWQWATTITSQEDSSRSAAFYLTTASGLSNIAKLYLQAMALLPEDNQEGDTYNSDMFYANNGIGNERCAARGGRWSSVASAGVFNLYLDYPRDYSMSPVGGRPAYAELAAE